jgi:hypothetical protein
MEWFGSVNFHREASWQRKNGRSVSVGLKLWHRLPACVLRNQRPEACTTFEGACAMK